MHRRIHSRLIVLLALLCQVLTGTFAHVPAAAAAATTTHEAQPCHEHAAGEMRNDAASVMSVKHHAPMPDPGSPFHHCKTGSCTCVCAHAAAALVITAVAQPAVFSHPPLPLSTSIPDAPLCISVFFRPPI